MKIILSTLLEKKKYEAIQLVSKIFLSAEFEKNREYTFEKNYLKPFGVFQTFS